MSENDTAEKDTEKSIIICPITDGDSRPPEIISGLKCKHKTMNNDIRKRSTFLMVLFMLNTKPLSCIFKSILLQCNHYNIYLGVN